MRAKVRVSEKKGELALEMERECVCVYVWTTICLRMKEPIYMVSVFA